MFMWIYADIKVFNERVSVRVDKGHEAIVC